jgi:hypothetical protein
MILLDGRGKPKFALNADDYLREMHVTGGLASAEEHCQQPIVITNPATSVDEILPKLDVEAEGQEDRVIDREVVLYWGERRKRILTGVDLLGRLLHGIVDRRVESSER